MAEVHQHTPPGGWPRGKSKDVGDHRSRDQSPSPYFDDDSTTLKDTKDAATDTTESTTKSTKKKIDDDSSQDEDDSSPGKTVKSAKKSADKKTKSTKDSADDNVKSTKDKADDTTKSAKDSTEKKAKSTKDSADDTAKSAKDTTEKHTKSTKDSADDAVKSTKDKADDTTKSAKDSAGKSVKSAKSKGDSDSKEEEGLDNNPMDELKAGLKGGGDDSKLKKMEPEPIELTDEEKKKLTPSGDISNVTKAAEEAESKRDDVPKTDDVPKADEAKEGATDAAEDATKDAPKTDDVPKADEAKEGVADAAEDATKDAPKTDIPEDKVDETKEGVTDAAEDATKDAPKTDDVPEGEDVVKEGEDAAKEGEDAAKEGEDAAKDAEAKAGEAGEEAGKDVEAPEGAEVPAEGEEALKEAEEEAPLDLSILKGAKVNKGGNLISEENKLVGRVKEGVLAHLIGKRCDENGIIWSDSGKQLGKAELIPEDEREGLAKEDAPFEAFPDAKVDSEGFVVSGDERIGKVVEGDIKKLRNMKVDADGDILDKQGSVAGRAERWEPEAEPEPEPEPEKDRSILAGKRVNKAGYLVDSSGAIFGRVVEGDAKKMIGRMSDAKGIIRSESGDELGRAEVVPEGEREGTKEGPFAELSGCTVRKDGMIVTPGNEIVGRLVSGDPKALFGREIDDDGEVTDKNGNVIGKAERWEPPEAEERKKGPLEGRTVNKEGLVNDDDGNVIAKLTSGDLAICAGNKIDGDNDVVNSKGASVGHVTLLQDIKEPEPEESADDKAKREKAEQDKKLAQQMSYCLTQCLDKIKPICQMITSKIEKAERTPKEELDEEELVKEVRPLIEEGGKILQEANGIIRGLDPDGRIQANAKHKTATHEATPEEYHLADILKELTGTVTQTIDNAKKKIEGMPHAKKELSPLWGLLSEPLFQILAAVGLLLNGVLGLVGRLLSGLGLGGIVDSLLGGLGVKNILEALGIGSLTDSLTGKNQKGGGKKKGGGLLGLGG